MTVAAMQLDGREGQISGNLAVSALDYSEGKVKLTTRPISGIRNEAQFSLLAEGRGWGVKDAPLRLGLKALEGSLQKSASLNHPALELILQKLQSFGPQLRVAPWIILPFFQSLKTPFPK